MSATPDPTDASADGNFGSSGSNRRAGYSSDKLANAEKWARKGGTLNAGEGLTLCKEIDRLREQVDEAYGELSISRLACEQLRQRVADAEIGRSIETFTAAEHVAALVSMGAQRIIASQAFYNEEVLWLPPEMRDER